jgi:dTDP-4-dehydrorhamnose 3,5-epimerase
MDIKPLAIPDVLLLTPRQFTDSRGFFAEMFSIKTMEAANLPSSFAQDNLSRSAHAGTVRGLHFQLPPFAQDKIIQVLRGRIFDVAVDLRRTSPTFGQHVVCELSEKIPQQLFIPAGFAHGYCTLEDDTDIFYKVGKPYSPDHDSGVLWNDLALKIDWPKIANPDSLSPRDRTLPRLADLPDVF